MTLPIFKTRTISELQQDFNNQYPFLKLEFYRAVNGAFMPLKKHLAHSTLLESAGLKNNGELGISDEMTVEQLEKSFHTLFGLNVQVSRKSGTLWLETTMTDKWSLQKQNEHGREISIPVERIIAEPDRES